MDANRSLRLRDRVVATVSWASRSYQPGTARRTAADAVVCKLKRPDVRFAPTSGRPGELNDLLSFAESARTINARMHADPASCRGGDDALLALGTGTCERFVRRPEVTFGEVRWILDSAWNGDLADDIFALSAEMDAIEGSLALAA